MEELQVDARKMGIERKLDVSEMQTWTGKLAAGKRVSDQIDSWRATDGWCGWRWS